MTNTVLRLLRFATVSQATFCTLAEILPAFYQPTALANLEPGHCTQPRQGETDFPDIMMRLPLCLLLVAVFSSIIAAAFQGQSNVVLVVFEDQVMLKTHSRFVDSLKAIGKTVEVKQANSESFDLRADGEYVYDSIVLLCPTATKMERKLSLDSLVRFVDAGHNLFVAAGHGYSDYTSKVASSIGVDLDYKRNKMTDHQQPFQSLDDGSHTIIRAGGLVQSKYLFGDENIKASDIVFSGPGATLFTDNELIDKVMWGSGSCYSTDDSRRPLSKIPRVAGAASVLAAALSTRTESRASYFGSIDTLSNDAFDKAGKKHEKALTSFLAWTVGHAGVLRTRNLVHSSIDDSGSLANEFRVKDTIKFSIDVQEWDGGKGVWSPYVADDMQVEFVMLDPWVRERLHYSGNENGTYTATIPVPDQIGVYKFNIQYFRPGLSPIVLMKVVPVRPYLHSEYERFIGMASPYYASSFSMLIGVFLLGLVILYGNKGEGGEHAKAD